VTDPQIRAYLESYVTNFPGLFDPAVRRTDVLCKTEHVIDTGDAEPVKLPPRRYSPAQLMAIRDFVETNPIIRKGIGPWASPLFLISKKPSETHVKPVVDETTIWRMCTDY
jgi:hypothetical protein